MKYPKVRDVLNRIKWMDTIPGGGIMKLEFVTLVVKDRVLGSKEISGADIARLGRREFEVGPPKDQFDPYGGIGLGNTTIPYYKVTEIWYAKGQPHGGIIWKRPETV